MPKGANNITHNFRSVVLKLVERSHSFSLEQKRQMKKTLLQSLSVSWLSHCCCEESLNRCLLESIDSG